MLQINNDSIADIERIWESLRRAAAVAYKPKCRICYVDIPGTDIRIEIATDTKTYKGRARMFRGSEDNLIAETGLCADKTLKQKVAMWKEMQTEIETRKG